MSDSSEPLIVSRSEPDSELEQHLVLTRRLCQSREWPGCRSQHADHYDFPESSVTAKLAGPGHQAASVLKLVAKVHDHKLKDSDTPTRPHKYTWRHNAAVLCNYAAA